MVTAINDKPVRTSTDLRNAIGLLRVGERIDVAVIRDGRPRRVTAIIPDPEPRTAAPVNGTGGAAAANAAIHPLLEGAVLVDAPDGGVLVRSIEPRSPAAQAQVLRSGDRIEAVNRQRVSNLQGLRALARGNSPLVLTVRRGNAIVLVPLRTP